MKNSIDGNTLIEQLIVLLLISIIATASTMSLSGVFVRKEIEWTEQAIQMAVDLAQSISINSDKGKIITADKWHNGFSVINGEEVVMNFPKLKYGKLYYSRDGLKNFSGITFTNNRTAQNGFFTYEYKDKKVFFIINRAGRMRKSNVKVA